MKEYIVQAFDFQETIVLDPFRAEDVPELIRCRDCRHFNWSTDSCECTGNLVSEKFYCADGERKEGR